jgi:exopolyphosphatase/guanosine-5'-triphosphate,3'-diphosphate pyrophosphatase
LGRKLAKLTVRQRAAIKGINSKRAEIVIAGATVYTQLLSLVGARAFRYSPLGLRDGLLAQMAAEYDQRARSHRQWESDREDALARMAARYRIDTGNATQVRDLALAIFDQTRRVHGLSTEFREWIATAASLYEVGAFVNPVGRHRHAYYIIAQSELFGFTPLQRKIIATIARYQGNSRPQLRDRLIKALPAQMRADVLKGTALLRVARALNQGRRDAVQRVRVAAKDGHVRMDVAASRGGADLELWAAEKEVSYFREVFGRELSFTLL